MSQMMRAVEAFVAKLGNEEILVQTTDIADSEHELVKRYPHLWMPIQARFGVEQATAAPGEERDVKVKVSKPVKAV